MSKGRVQKRRTKRGRKAPATAPLVAVPATPTFLPGTTPLAEFPMGDSRRVVASMDNASNVILLGDAGDKRFIEPVLMPFALAALSESAVKVLQQASFDGKVSIENRLVAQLAAGFLAMQSVAAKAANIAQQIRAAAASRPNPSGPQGPAGR